MADLTGQIVNHRYRVDEFLGEGGMSRVYKVWDLQRSVYLAMKVLRADYSEDMIFLRRFKREAQVIEHLQHPHIVRFYGLEKEGRLAYLLMDYIDGSTLRGEIYDTGRPFSMQHILEVVRPVCAALGFAHQKGMVHCDVKPANIMIEKNGRVLLNDFGIARHAEGATTATMVGMGTPAYMAPEQVQGLEPTPQTDIYALGIVLYEMLTGGERPFTGEKATITGSTSEKVRWEQVNLAPVSPRKYDHGIAPDVEAVVMKCLEKEPGKRYASVLELLTALELAPGMSTPPIKKKEEAVAKVPIGLTCPRCGETVEKDWSSCPKCSMVLLNEMPSKLPQESMIAKQKKKRTGRIWWPISVAVLGLILWGSGVLNSLTTLVTMPETVDENATNDAASIVYEKATNTVAMIADKKATNAAASTADARSLQEANNSGEATATAQASKMADLIQELYSKKFITSTSGSYTRLEDTINDFAQLHYFQWIRTDKKPKNFVIRTDMTLEAANKSTNWAESGCGFMFHDDENQVEDSSQYTIHAALLYMDGYMRMFRLQKGQWGSLTGGFAGKLDTPKANAEMILAVDGEQITVLINGTVIVSMKDKYIGEGTLSFAQASGSNADFGMRCAMKNIDLWILP